MKKNELFNVQVLRDSMDYIGYFLTVIINESFSTGNFPNHWKEATVVPIPKVINAKDAENFRGINMLPIHEKVIESSVYQQLSDHLQANGILYENQSGFRDDHSCETALNSVILKWKHDIEKGMVVLKVFLDFKRAFETIDRKILIQKLHRMGVREIELKWFKSYLSNRTQRVKVEDCLSEANLVELGISQGTVLGTLLFILYINDIPSAVRFCELYLFADDTALTISARSCREAFEKANNDLAQLFKWLCANKLMLNTNKSKFMLMNTKPGDINNDCQIRVNGEAIERVDSIKYLGVIIDENLKFYDLFDYTVKEAAKKVGFLQRVSH